MDQASTILAEAEALQQQFEQTLEMTGLSMDELRHLADRIRRKLPAAELRRVEAATRALSPHLRRLAGTSDLSLPTGIRG